ncbi:MAG: glycosyl hydrolase family 28 protein [Planctomycetia bacterium]|nr:glycosyl hydrolase family 28 protein [Planctomycetia bacterium]
MKKALFCFLMFAVLWTVPCFSANEASPKNDPNHYSGTDSERIAAAVQYGSAHGGIVRIPARLPDKEANRNCWLLDSAILLSNRTTLILENCKIKLSDQCRDNFIRSANCGIGIEKPAPLEEIHILGIGQSELIGADHPRSTGDGNKILGQRSYGTDAGKPNESQKGDWRNIGILFANVKNFSIQNLTVRQAHCWAISLEKCSCGKVSDIVFDATEVRTIDGTAVKTLNQDGLDLRKGCHNIMIENISGNTGDDLVALTAIRISEKKGGTLEATEVAETDPNAMNDIHHITIRNVIGHSKGGHQLVRFLNASGMRIHHVLLDGLIDTSPEDLAAHAAVRIGDSNPSWGGITPLGDTYGLTIINIQSRAKAAILIAGSLTDSIIANVINYHPDVKGITYGSGKDNVKNVVIGPFLNAERTSNLK